MAYYLIPGLWLAWLAYWIHASRDAKSTLRTEPAASRLMHTLPLAAAAWLVAADRAPFGWRGGNLVADPTLAFVAGVVLLAIGLAFAVRARACLGRNWSGLVTLKQDHELVRSGPYRYVRHPIYSGILLAFVGTALARNEWRGVLAVAIAILALWRKLQVEEQWMVEQFGDAYRAYRREVPALIPNPFARVGAER